MGQKLVPRGETCPRLLSSLRFVGDLMIGFVIGVTLVEPVGSG